MAQGQAQPAHEGGGSAQGYEGKQGQQGAEERKGAKGKESRAGKEGDGSQSSKPDSPAQVQKYLGGLDYPVSKQQLVEKARQEGASEEVMRLLEQLPDQEYGSPVAVSKEYGRIK